MHVSPRCGGVGKERLQKSTMDIMQWLTQNPAGEFCFTMLVSMVPVVELRGGIPFGVARGLPVWAAYLAAIIGNILPVPFILVYIRRIFQWMRRRLPRLNRLVDKGYLACEKKGRGNLYRALIGEEEYKAAEGRGILDRLYGGSFTGMVASLCSGKAIGKDALAELRQYLDTLEGK